MKRGCLWQLILLIILAILFVLTEIKIAMNYEHEDDPVESNATNKTCHTCKFERSGRCHRLPPVVLHRLWEFPAVNPTDWCGEWKSND